MGMVQIAKEQTSTNLADLLKKESPWATVGETCVIANFTKTDIPVMFHGTMQTYNV
jgi:hypothetical protein